jgi:hypothetical protein
MRMPRFSLARTLSPYSLIPALLFLLLSTNLLAAPAVEVIALRGSGEVIANGKTTALTVGLQLEQGAEIRTHSPGRCKLRFPDDSVVIVSDASQLRLETLTEGPAASSAPSAFVDELFTQPRMKLKQVQLMLGRGLIGQTVTDDPERPWAVKGRSAVTAVRGTQFEVEVTDDLTYDVHITRGSIAVTPVAATDDRPTAAEPQTYILDKPGLGISCHIDTGCNTPKPWGEERMSKMFKRLEGV